MTSISGIVPSRSLSSPKQKRPERRSARRRPATLGDWLRIIVPTVLLVSLVVVGWQLGYFDLREPQKLEHTAARVRHIPWFVPAFILGYAALAALASPVSPLAYGAGAVFGIVEGSILVWISSMIGAFAGYLLARTIWSESAKRLLGRHGRKLSELGHGNVFLRVLRLQLTPIVPFGLMNYAAGTTRLRFVPYAAGTALGVIPMTIAAVYVGDRLRAGVRGSGLKAYVIAGIVMAAIIGLSFLPSVRRHDQESEEE